jgi:hypothetical protein
MDEITRRRHQYDLPTAVTFLIVGLGLGSVLTLLFSSRLERAFRFRPNVSEDAPHAAAS